MSNNPYQQRAKRRAHIRKRIRGTKDRPRLVVRRSNKHIYAQFINDLDNKTLLGVSSLNSELQSAIKDAKSKTEVAKLVGKKAAELAQQQKINKVVFDRAGYLYHGRIKALADGAREGGLDF